MALAHLSQNNHKEALPLFEKFESLEIENDSETDLTETLRHILKIYKKIPAGTKRLEYLQKNLDLELAKKEVSQEVYELYVQVGIYHANKGNMKGAMSNYITGYKVWEQVKPKDLKLALHLNNIG